MQDPRYFRDRATQCLQLARQLSDAQAAEVLRKRAAEYVAYADTLGDRTDAAVSSPKFAKGHDHQPAVTYSATPEENAGTG